MPRKKEEEISEINETTNVVELVQEKETQVVENKFIATMETFLTSPEPMIHKAMANCVKDAGLMGIEKDSKNKFQDWNYRSIDSCLAAFNKIFSKNGIYTVQRTLNTKWEHFGIIVDPKTKREAVHWGVTCDLEVTFFAQDGSHTKPSITSIANDGKDRTKLMGQATSYANKDLYFMTFVVPVKGADDIDSRDEDGRPVSVLPKPLANKKGVVWEKANLSLGVSTTLEWAGRMTGKTVEEVQAILDSTPADENGKKGQAFLNQIEMIWSSN